MPEEDYESHALELLYPFYLDTDMSMAFAAALAGGVSLEEERLDRGDETSQAVRNLRGNLRLFGTGGVGGKREATEAASQTSESRLVRRHTVASIFIDLYDELRRTRRLTAEPAFQEIAIGDIVSVKMGPAVAPLWRVVDQVIRLLDVTVPMLAPEEADGSRQHRQKKPHAKRSAQDAPDEDLAELRQLHRLLVALRDDLEHSGMIDVVVSPDDGASAVLTLDKRFVSSPTLELLHTSAFTVVGKVTGVWQDQEDVINLHRRSVVALAPVLSQTTVWGLFAFLGGLARGIDVKAMERMAREAIGATDSDPDLNSMGEPKPGEARPATPDDPGPAENSEDASEEDEVLFGADAMAALNPVVFGPAYQVLPLAICS